MTDIVEAVEQEDDPWNEVARDCAEVAVRSDQRTTDRPEITSTPRNIERTLCCLAGHPQDLDPQPRADLRHSRERDRRADRAPDCDADQHEVVGQDLADDLPSNTAYAQYCAGWM